MKKILLLIWILSILISCSKTKKSYSTEEKEGITYIHNYKTDLSETKLIQDMVISDDVGSFSEISMIKEDSAGNIYVLDSKDNAIKVFSNDGKFIRKIGNKGKGPGEFIRPMAFGFLKSGDLIVSDSENRRFQTFDKSGNYITSYKIETGTLGLFIIDDQNRIISDANKFSFADAKKVSPIYTIYDDKMNKIEEIGKQTEYADLFKSYIMNRNYFVSFKNILFTVYSVENKILIFNDDKLAKKIDRKLRFVPMKPNINSKNNNGQISFSASYDPISYDVSVDSKGNFYVLANEGTKDKEERRIIEIYNSYGILLKLIGINDITPNKIYIGKEDKIYLNNSDDMTIHRFKSIL